MGGGLLSNWLFIHAYLTGCLTGKNLKKRVLKVTVMSPDIMTSCRDVTCRHNYVVTSGSAQSRSLHQKVQKSLFSMW